MSPNRIVCGLQKQGCCCSLTLYHPKPLSVPPGLSAFLSHSLSGISEQLETVLPNPCLHWKKMNMGAELFPPGLHMTDFHRKQSAGLWPNCVCVCVCRDWVRGRWRQPWRGAAHCSNERQACVWDRDRWAMNTRLAP